MAKIIPHDFGVEVQLAPEEVLRLPPLPQEKIVDILEMIGNGAWKLLCLHGRKFVEKKENGQKKMVQFAYKNTQFIDGYFQIFFFYAMQYLPKAPSEP